jgi:hypothetical protein
MISENDWRTLLGKIRAGYCTPFIGAGAADGVLPSASQLAQDLLSDEESGTSTACPLPNREDLARVSQYLAVTHQDGTWPKMKIAERIRRSPRPNFEDENEPHRTLADLNLPIYLTTNYDAFMVDALRAKGRAVKREFARWTERLLADHPSAFDTGYRPNTDEPVVFHLHGHTEVQQSLVASEDDYLDFLVRISKELGTNPRTIREKAILPPRIRSALAGTTLLFIGYSLNDINFRVILRGLVGSLERSSRHIHIAVQLSSGSARELDEYLEQYFRWTLDLSVFWGTAREFSAQLRRRLRNDTTTFASGNR